MDLSSILINDSIKVISIIGAGGKTKLLRILAEENRNTKKVLVTSTVNIDRIPEAEVDFVDYEYRNDYGFRNSSEKGVYVISHAIDNSNRMRGLTLSEIERQLPYFELSIIESDQSKQRHVKVWRPNEPLISDQTDLTLGVLDISALGKRVNVDNIHNLDLFVDFTGKKVGSEIEAKDLLFLVNDPRMMFRTAKGKKALFINKAEGYQLNKAAYNIAAGLNYDEFDLIVVGSLKNRVYDVLKALE